MNKEHLPKREELIDDLRIKKEEVPSIRLYLLLILFAFELLFLSFALSKPDWPGFLLNLATEIFGAVIILALVERKLRRHEIDYIAESANNLWLKTVILAFPDRKRIRDYLNNSSLAFNKLDNFYINRPYIEDQLRIQNNSFMLIGQAGEGKTTLLQHLYILICNKCISSFYNTKIPVFISAKHINPEISFIDDTLCFHFEKYSKIQLNEVKEYLKAGKIYLTIDALDEIKPDDKDRVINIIRDFMAGWPKNQVIVSSRDITYQSYNLGLEIIRIPELESIELQRIVQSYKLKQRKT